MQELRVHPLSGSGSAFVSSALSLLWRQDQVAQFQHPSGGSTKSSSGTCRREGIGACGAATCDCLKVRAVYSQALA